MRVESMCWSLGWEMLLRQVGGVRALGTQNKKESQMPEGTIPAHSSEEPAAAR